MKDFALNLSKKQTYHFIGINGISMSGIAQLLLEQGFKVSGSDLKSSPRLEKLKDLDAVITQGHFKENIKADQIVVYSSAIPHNNPEFKQAQELKLPLWPRAKLLAALMENYFSIAVSGTHGKTTSTAMLAHIFEQANLKPTVMIGGDLDTVGGNAKKGTGSIFITEADESDGSFLYYAPYLLIINNIELDHPDYFKDLKQLQEIFIKLIARVPHNGFLLYNSEDENIDLILKQSKPRCKLLSYGLLTGDLQVKNLKLGSVASQFEVLYDQQKLGLFKLNIPGEHNVKNALGAIAAALQFKVALNSIKQSLLSFPGVKRRFQIIKKTDQLTIVDDYAHHPTEIKACLTTARHYTTGRVIAIFQAHRYSRLTHLFSDFKQSLLLADVILITAVYAAGEKPGTVDAQDLYQELRALQKKVAYFADQNEIIPFLKTMIKEGDLIVTLGAGDINQVAYDLAAKVSEA